MPRHPLTIALLACVQLATAQSDGEVLTKIRDVISLSEERASSEIPVSVSGVVTAAPPDWNGQFFVQDDTSGIFVSNYGREGPQTGDVVVIKGVSNAGGFAPIIIHPEWEKVGTAPLPAAKKVSIEELMTGIEDSQRIEVSGIVRMALLEERALVLYIKAGSHRLRAAVPLGVVDDPGSLIGARVRLRGTAATNFNPESRQIITVNLMVPLAEDFVVEAMEPSDPFKKDAIPINKLAQYNRDHLAGQRIRVLGTVTYQRPGKDLFINDGTGGLRVRTRQNLTVKPGDRVEVVGFPEFDQFLPIVQDALVNKIEAPSDGMTPEFLTVEDLPKFHRHADLVTLQAQVLDMMVGSAGTADEPPSDVEVSLVLQAGEHVFTAEGPAAKSNVALLDVPLGSTVELTGICMLQVEENGVVQSFQILLPEVGNVRVLKKPSWFTPGRLLAGLALLTAVLVLAFAWVVTVSRKNAALKQSISDKIAAQNDLQKAHDSLDQRVQERTEQLKFEMNERKEAEVRFRATLAERTRLAQELHDTTEQSLTGIGLQLDTAAKLFKKDPDGGRKPLEMARNLIDRSHIELRRSIWNLRSRELEQFMLPDALKMSVREMVEGAEIETTFKIIGEVRPLSEVIEENLLRLAREASANVVKHAKASRLDLFLKFGPQSVSLVVADDGCGFDPDKAPGAGEGHFGLLGMSERAKRFNGTLRVISSPENGTRLEIEIPTNQTSDRETVGATGIQTPS
ncbi:histidine kinase [Haloferula sp.]|uniref:histidine kinase n=1 Tax=Haloferula sp. TaxID=2497595 RepID=UPI003C77CFEA